VDSGAVDLNTYIYVLYRSHSALISIISSGMVLFTSSCSFVMCYTLWFSWHVANFSDFYHSSYCIIYSCNFLLSLLLIFLSSSGSQGT